MNEFDFLLRKNISSLECYVKFKVNNKYDAEDIIQDACLSATERFTTLRDKNAFKAWLIGIAKHKVNDYYRSKARRMDIPYDSLTEKALGISRFGVTECNIVSDVIEKLADKDKQILYLYYFKSLPQEDIAKQLQIPIGTVKSRLYYAKKNFKHHYQGDKDLKGEIKMSKIPEIVPKYTIKATEEKPFSVKWEELQGWLLIPRLNERITWGLYDASSGKRTEYTEMKAIGKAEIHGIEGVEISAVQYNAEDYYRTGSVDKMERRFVAQLTDTHCRYLAESHIENGVRKLYTFLDGDDFINNWGFGEDNCGKEVNLAVKGLLKREGNKVTGYTEKETVDIVGRYTLTVGDKAYDTICVMDIQCFNDGVVSEQYLDKNGRTVLWRRFNKNDWAFDRYGKLWTEILPDNERLTINGETYVHWYDCASDYIF